MGSAGSASAGKERLEAKSEGPRKGRGANKRRAGDQACPLKSAQTKRDPPPPGDPVSAERPGDLYDPRITPKGWGCPVADTLRTVRGRAKERRPGGGGGGRTGCGGPSVPGVDLAVGSG